MSFKFISNIFILFIFSYGILLSQQDSGKPVEGINTNIPNEESFQKDDSIVSEIGILRNADSVKIALLNQQIEFLKSTDSLKKDFINNQIDSLKNKDSYRTIRLKNRIDSLKTIVKGYPVAPFGDTLFTVYLKQGAYSAEERAKNISSKIIQMEKDFAFTGDSIIIDESESATDLLYRGMYILSITENDELWKGSTKKELAEKYKAVITKAIFDYREATSFRAWLKKAGLILLVLAVVILIIYFVKKLSGKLNKKLVESKDKRVKGVKIGTYELFNSDRVLGILILINKYVRWFINLTLIYFSLPLLFWLFPKTRSITDTLLGYIIDPLKGILASIWNYFPNLITIIIIIILFRYALKGLLYLKNEIERGALKIPGFYSDWANPTFQIVRVLVFAFMIVVIFPYLPGSNSPVFQGVSVFLGFLFTFGSAGSLSNIIAGLVLTYMRAFKLGDRVKIADVTGDIIEKSLLVTRIRTVKNEEITIPNSNIMNTHTINYSSAAQDLGLILNTTVTIGYDAPWRQVHQLLINAALATDFIVTEPKPFVLQTSLDDFYVSYMINVYTKEPNKQASIYSQLHQNIQDKFNEAGVEIMSPHYNSLRDGNTVTIPPDYLSKDYKSPSFKINNPDKDNIRE